MKPSAAVAAANAVPFTSPPEPPGDVLHALADDALMALAREGQRRAFDVLVQRYQPTLKRMARKHLVDANAADEAVQRSIVELYRYVPHYQPCGKLAHLLWRILLNQCRQSRRAAHSERRALRRVAELPRAPVSTPIDTVLDAEYRQRLAVATARLSEPLRAVLTLRFAAALPYADIADVLGIPLGTVKSRLAAALDKLKQLMEADPAC